MSRLTAVLALAASASAFGQVEGPLFGYLPDGARLRPVYGIAASASIGAAADYGRDFSRIAVSPRQDYAIVAAADTGAVFVASPTGAMTPIPGADANPDRIFLSPRGSAALLWSASSGRLQFLTGLSGSLSVRNASATFLNTLPHAFAVSDDGQFAAGAFADGLWLFGPQGQATPLPSQERALSLAFFAGRPDLAVATATHVFSIKDVGGQPTVSQLYEGPRMAPVGLAVSADNQHLVAAEVSGSLLSLDLSSGGAARFDCGCSPEGAFSMGRSVFRFTGLKGAVFKVFDASTGEVFFVPLAQGSGDSAQGGQQ